MFTESRKSILVVEDDAATRDAVALVLEDEGYSVTGVANGQEALHHLRQTPPPNLILLDLMMPVMNGWGRVSSKALYQPCYRPQRWASPLRPDL